MNNVFEHLEYLATTLRRKPETLSTKIVSLKNLTIREAAFCIVTMNILGIETSCDDTAAAVVADGKIILSNVISSQNEFHAKYGGIVPEIQS